MEIYYHRLSLSKEISRLDLEISLKTCANTFSYHWVIVQAGYLGGFSQQDDHFLSNLLLDQRI